MQERKSIGARPLQSIAKAECASATSLEYLEGQLRAYILAARSTNTHRSYASDWKTFQFWCQNNGLEYLPPSPRTLSLFMVHRASEVGVSTLRRNVFGIRCALRDLGHEETFMTPAVQSLLKGICRTHGVRETPSSPFWVEDVLEVARTIPPGIRGHRDRAILLLGFAAALRRSELADLRLADADFNADGLSLHVRRSKTDQAGVGCVLSVPRWPSLHCPVAAVRVWMEVGAIKDGYLFRRINTAGQVGDSISPFAISAIVKKVVANAGCDLGKITAHSLRSGFASSAAAAQVPEAAIMTHGRWKSASVMRRYVRAR